MKKQKKYIFVTGGVLSGLGKGTSAAALAMLLEARGLKVSMIKMDPYLNVDPGTMSPFQHGEVYVLDDGSETDLDLGHYSRFVQNVHFSKKNSFTSGRIYEAVIRKERAGDYLGKTVQVIPHITDEIKAHIEAASVDADIVLIEVGGTVGDIESLPFLEAIRQMRTDQGWENVVYVHLTLVPYVKTAGELKTKPTQHSVKELREIGIQPDILLCRTDRSLDMSIKSKIGLFCNLLPEAVFSAKDVSSIYELPLYFHQEGIDERIVQRLSIWTAQPHLQHWKDMVYRIQHPEHTIKIMIVGKYVQHEDMYKSLAEALVHGATQHFVKLEVEYYHAEQLRVDVLQGVHGILVPGGFGHRGIEGKIAAIQYAREHKVPFLGICLGMQLAVIEYARNVVGLAHAGSSEFLQPEGVAVIDLLKSQQHTQHLGGSMRLGSYACDLEKTVQGMPTLAYRAYQQDTICERHRHRYEVSPKYVEQLQKAGMVVSGKYRVEGDSLVEIVEVPDHPWFLACQFHPEFKSHPLKPHPLFSAFIQAALEHKKP